jgi:Predicted membrane protein
MQDVAIETAPTTVGAPQPDAETVSASFDGRRGPLFRLCLVNLLLTIVTFGVYRFWARTHVRRYFWSHTRIGTDRFEYTGTGLELLIGFLIFVAAVTIPGVVLELLAPMVASYLGTWHAMAFSAGLQILYAIGLPCLIWVAVYRMWRYRLSRTLWRGIRFHLGGSTWAFVVRSIKRSIIVILTLGIGWPYFSIGQTRDIATNARFGTTLFSFNGSGMSLLGAWLVHWGITVASIVGVIALFGSEATGAGEIKFHVSALIPGIVAGAIVLASLVRYQVVERRYVLSHLGFAEAQFESNLSSGAVLGTVLLYLFALAWVVVAGVLVGWGVFLLTASGLPVPADAGTISEDLLGKFSIPVVLALSIMILFVSVLSPSLKHVVLTFGFAHHFFSTLRVINPQAFDRATRDTTAEMPRFGEGLAQGFDIGAI